MNIQIEPIRAESLTDIFISRFEELIFSGQFRIGERLPSERDLARRMGVSRPVVHEGLVKLAAMGLVTMVPRVGTLVNDYRKEGSLALLSSLVNYGQGRIDPILLRSLLDLRMLFETENARLAARNRTDDQLLELKDIIRREGAVDKTDIEEITEVDFAFHLQVSMASANMVYPLLINSFKKVYTSLTGIFFTDPGVTTVVFDLHRKLAAAIEDSDEKKSASLMKRLLKHGEEHLAGIMKKQTGGIK